MKFKVNPKVFLAELIGTFALVFIGAGAGAQVADVGVVSVAFAHGLVIALFIYAYGPISGTHINPAVTLALAINNVIEWTDAIVYWIAQFLASMLAAAALYFIFNGAKNGLGATTLDGLGGTLTPVVMVQGLLIEAILTFFLVTAVFHTAVSGKVKDFAGLIIGLTVTACIFLGGPLTGAALNPARSFGPAIFTGTFASLYWIYLVGPVLGAVGAAFLYRYMTMSTKKSASSE
jgi:MIP family channel proteins